MAGATPMMRSAKVARSLISANSGVEARTIQTLVGKHCRNKVEMNEVTNLCSEFGSHHIIKLGLLCLDSMSLELSFNLSKPNLRVCWPKRGNLTDTVATDMSAHHCHSCVWVTNVVELIKLIFNYWVHKSNKNKHRVTIASSLYIPRGPPRVSLYPFINSCECLLCIATPSSPRFPTMNITIINEADGYQRN